VKKGQVGELWPNKKEVVLLTVEVFYFLVGFIYFCPPSGVIGIAPLEKAHWVLEGMKSL